MFPLLTLSAQKAPSVIEKSLDPDQGQHVGPDLDPNCLWLKDHLKNLKLFKKKTADNKKV